MLHRAIGFSLVSSVAFCAVLVASSAAHARPVYSFSNTTPIEINAAGADFNVSTTDLYPSPIVVSGIDPTESVVSLSLTLNGYSHTDTNAVMAVFRKSGTSLSTLLFDGPGDVGNSVSDLTLSFADGAANTLPVGGTFGSDTYQPGFISPGYDDVLPAGNVVAPAEPAPAESAQNLAGSFAGFNGTDPNGTYHLFVNGFYPDSSGQLSRGWQLTITTNAVVVVPEAGTLPLVSAGVLLSLAAVSVAKRRRHRTA